MKKNKSIKNSVFFFDTYFYFKSLKRISHLGIPFIFEEQKTKKNDDNRKTHKYKNTKLITNITF
ncbi:hypothetical protein MCEGE10_02021 [Flavobacteriaceae bacterium]